jgi:CRISPR-associated protein Cas1
MYALRFGEAPPAKRSVDQLRGIEGARVRKIYESLAKRYKVRWKRRDYDPAKWDAQDPINRALSSANSCLYGICEAAILAAGYAPAIGFIHAGKPRSFVFDIADLVKFDTVVPLAFETTAKKPKNIDREVRLRCRDVFREHKLLGKLIPMIDEVLAAGELQPPERPTDMLDPAFEDAPQTGDAGHRG